MSFRQPDELQDLAIAGVQIGDTSLLTPDAIVHLPSCSIWGNGYTSDGKPVCSCGAVLAKASEFYVKPEIEA